jgi:hypothetical protein
MAIWSIFSNLVYFVTMCFSLWLFGIFFPVLVCCTEKNLATLNETKSVIDYTHSYVHEIMTGEVSKRLSAYGQSRDSMAPNLNETEVMVIGT